MSIQQHRAKFILIIMILIALGMLVIFNSLDTTPQNDRELAQPSDTLPEDQDGESVDQVSPETEDIPVAQPPP